MVGAPSAPAGRLAFTAVGGHVNAPSGRRRRVPAAVTCALPSIPSGRAGRDFGRHTHQRRGARRAWPPGVDGGAGDEAARGRWSRGRARTVPVAVIGPSCMPAALSLSVLGAGVAIGVAGAIFEVMLNVLYGSVRLGPSQCRMDDACVCGFHEECLRACECVCALCVCVCGVST
eukprot:TRINITY_DN3734_c0_g1_i2.p4 TRINITY_DN3734_c0_g1~~TRINITY_DN3734_c0_g1_i2.p4  ORF type:complete len:174 (+),score=7.78 TRINITY_DN3734_c0_g1_i2:483-1004(+)